MRVIGAVELLALGAVVMPTRWMGQIHQLMGLGEMPTGPLVEYLTRSASLLYALIGAMTFYLSFDVVGRRDVIAFLMKLMIVFGMAMLALDMWIGMPVMWTAFEGPIVMVMGVGVLTALHRATRNEPSPQAASADNAP